MSHWKHALSTMRVRGVWRGSCSCGWQSQKAALLDDVKAAYDRHTKLVEREAKRPAEGA